ncbi:hypothetical protein I33_3794 [Bacillus subtilis subsp. subtilis str. RO-NN-1]|nr:hypothetical protein I33_3794 [Bacillus subtilis subsp. subtilis str. RO-NN-1]
MFQASRTLSYVFILTQVQAGFKEICPYFSRRIWNAALYSFKM